MAGIRAYARKFDPDFLVFPHNSPELAALASGYLNSVDGIGQDNIYFGYYDDNQATASAVTAEIEAHLDRFRDAVKLVLTVDYATTPDRVDEAYRRSRERVYVPFVTTLDLDRLTINAGHSPK